MQYALSPLAILLTLVLVTSSVWAADGHDHGGGETKITIAPRVESRFDNFQVVLVYANRRQYEDKRFQFFGKKQIAKFADPRIVVFLENFLTGEPATGAILEAAINFVPEALNEVAPGVYVTNNIILGGGRNEIELSYDVSGKVGTLPMMLVVPGGETSGATVTTVVAPPVKIPDWVFLLIIVVIYLGVMGVYSLRRPAHRSLNKSHTAQSASDTGDD